MYGLNLVIVELEAVSLVCKLLPVRHVLSVTVAEMCCCSCSSITDGGQTCKWF